MSRIRPFLIPLILAALTLLYMMAFLRPPTGREALDGHDLVYQQYPLLSLIFDSLRDGRGLPLWNPYQFAGQSIVANPQATLFYPLAWIMIPLGVPRGVGWLITLHLWIGAWGMAQFTRQLGATRSAALIAGIVYGFSALMGAHLNAGHLNYLLCQAWLPWIATAYLWSLTRQRWLLAALPGAAALGLCILSGYPPLLYFALIWLAALWIWQMASASKDRLHVALMALRPLIGIGVGGCLLGAALLLPVGQFTLRSTRTQAASLGFSASYALPAGQLITLIFPNFFGTPQLPDEGYWGLPFYEETTAYFGILPLLAILLVSRYRQRKAAILLVIFVVVGTVVSLGIDGGLFPTLYWLLPGYNIFRVPSRALYFVVVGGAGLTALLISELEIRDQDGRAALLRPAIRWMLPLLAVLAMMGSFALMGYFTAHSADPTPPWRVLFSGNMVALAVVAIVCTWIALRLWQSTIGRRAVLLVTVLVVLFDVWHISQPLVTVSAIDVQPLWKALAKVAPASPDYRVMTVPDQIIWQAGAAFTHHLNASGYDPLVGETYQRLLDSSQHNPTSPVSRLLGVRYAITDKPYEWQKLPGIEDLALLSDADGWYIYEVKNPLPRVFVAPTIQVNADDEAVRQQLGDPAFDPVSTVFVDHEVTCGSSGTSNARITHYEANTVDIAAQGPGLLVLTDSYDPAWVVTVDNTPAELLRVDTALRGVCLPHGSHQVHFEYRSTAFTIGTLVSAIAWVLLAITAVIAGLLTWQRARATP